MSGQNFHKLLRGLDQRKENDRLPILAVGFHLSRNLFKIWIKRGSDFACCEVSGLYADLTDIQFQRDCECFDRAEITFLDCSRKRIFISQIVKVLSKIAHITTIRSRRDAKYMRILKMLQYRLIARRNCMMRLINNDCSEKISREP